MVQNSSRLAHLLGEMRRQMNGAVVGGMRFYGEEYGLNYGVSLATVRAIARGEVEVEGVVDSEVNHRYAKLLYQQEVRELRLAAFYLADSSRVGDELDFWARGIINTEVAEEAAFALLSRCEIVDKWLDEQEGSEGSELLQYTALMSIAQRQTIDLKRYTDRIATLIKGENHILSNAVVALLDSAIRKIGKNVHNSTDIVDNTVHNYVDKDVHNFVGDGVNNPDNSISKSDIEHFMNTLPECGATEFIRGEIAWRLEFA